MDLLVSRQLCWLPAPRGSRLPWRYPRQRRRVGRGRDRKDVQPVHGDVRQGHSLQLARLCASFPNTGSAPRSGRLSPSHSVTPRYTPLHPVTPHSGRLGRTARTPACSAVWPHPKQATAPLSSDSSRAGMAVYLASFSRDVIGKMVSIWFCISAFVALGLEHSVANMVRHATAHDTPIHPPTPRRRNSQHCPTLSNLYQ